MGQPPGWVLVLDTLYMCGAVPSRTLQGAEEGKPSASLHFPFRGYFPHKQCGFKISILSDDRVFWEKKKKLMFQWAEIGRHVLSCFVSS